MTKFKSYPVAQPATLHCVLHHILTLPNLAPRRRRDMVSALRSLERLTGQLLATVSAEVPSVRKLMAGVRPALHEMSHKRWTNLRSLVLAALDVAGIARRPGRSKVKVSPTWEHYLHPLPYRPYRLALMPFARFCSASNIEPTEVCQATFTDFERELDELSGRSRPREAYRAACGTWNAARREFSQWADLVEVALVDHRQDYARPWSAFPESLKAEVDTMAQTLLDPDPLSLGASKRLRPATVKARVWGCRALASALVSRGYRPETLTGIASLVEVDAARESLRFFYERGGKHKSAHVHNFARLLITLTKYWVYGAQHSLSEPQKKLRDVHLESLTAMRESLVPDRPKMTAKNRCTLRPFRDEHMVDKLLALPGEIWRRYPVIKDLKRVDLVQLQLALAIEILTVAPIRLKNLVAIEVDRHLIWTGSGRRRRVVLQLPAEDMKNGDAMEFELPDSAQDLLVSYLAEVRARLAGDSPYLFPGEKVGPKRDYLLSKQIADLTAFEIGVRITAHQFRHIAGLLFLRANPGSFEVVRCLLGHKSIATTMRFYAELATEEAVRHYDGMIAQMRSASRSPRRR